MLRDNDANTQNMGVTKVLVICKQIAEENEGNKSQSNCFNIPKSSLVPMFHLPSKYYESVDIESYQQQPPAIEKSIDTEIGERLMKPLSLYQSCHNQTVERHVKSVTEACAQVTGYKRRDELIRQKIKSCNLMRKFDTNEHFNFMIFID